MRTDSFDLSKDRPHLENSGLRVSIAPGETHDTVVISNVQGTPHDPLHLCAVPYFFNKILRDNLLGAPSESIAIRTFWFAGRPNRESLNLRCHVRHFYVAMPNSTGQRLFHIDRKSGSTLYQRPNNNIS